MPMGQRKAATCTISGTNEMNKVKWSNKRHEKEGGDGVEALLEEKAQRVANETATPTSRIPAAPPLIFIYLNQFN